MALTPEQRRVLGGIASHGILVKKGNFPRNTNHTSRPFSPSSTFPSFPLDSAPHWHILVAMQLPSTPVPQPSPNLPPAVQKLSHGHDAILNWLLLNPTATLRECGDQLGYSVPWLSRLIHTDIFQAELAARQGEVFVSVAQGIPQKLAGLADIAIEKVTEQLLASESPQYALDVFDKALTKLGYAPQSPRNPNGGGTTNVFMVSAGDLAAARTTINSGGTPSEHARLAQLAAPGDIYEQFSSGAFESGVGHAAPVHQGEACEGQESPGDSL